MTGDFAPIDTVAGLDEAIRESFAQPVLILKHSVACGVSAQAFDQLQAWLAGGWTAGRPYIVIVQTARDVARAITDRLGIRHESPQALVLKDGKVVWHASHFRVTPSAVEKAVSAAA